MEGSGGFVRDPVDPGADPSDQLPEAGPVVREPGCSPLGRREGVEPVLGDVDPDGATAGAHVFFPFPVLVVRASMLMYPFRTWERRWRPNSRTALAASDPTARPPSVLDARSGSLRSPLRASSTPGHPRDPDLQIKQGSPRMEETSDPAVRGPATGSGPGAFAHPDPALSGRSLTSNPSREGVLRRPPESASPVVILSTSQRSVPGGRNLRNRYLDRVHHAFGSGLQGRSPTGIRILG